MAASSSELNDPILIIDSSDESSSDICEIKDKPLLNIDTTIECPICLQKCIHPARLPCGHIFCFLCVKGVAYKNRRCAMCRRDIPPEFLDHPQLVNGIEELKKSLSSDEGYQWFYEGRNGWWQYDERTSQELEESYTKQEKTCSILVAGFVYTVDFTEMLQLRKNDPSRQRRVKRDLSNIPKKGVAGLRIDSNNTVVTSHVEERTVQTNNDSNFISPIAVTDAAIRIASNIIDSTLAHANSDELESNSADNVHSLNHQHHHHHHHNHQLNNINSSNNRNSLSLANSSFEILDQAEEILELNTINSASINLPSPNICIFSQTIDSFRNLNLRNVLDSSDSEDDNEQIIL